MRLSVLILLNNTHQIAHLSLLYLACRAGTTELFYGAWSTKKLACFIMSCSTDGLVSHCESWHNWVILLGMQHNWVILWCWEIGYSTTGLFHAAHNWVISSCWVRISHGGHGTTGLFHAAHHDRVHKKVDQEIDWERVPIHSGKKVQSKPTTGTFAHFNLEIFEVV